MAKYESASMRKSQKKICANAPFATNTLCACRLETCADEGCGPCV